MREIETVLEEIGKGGDLERVFRTKSWQSFEEFVSWIFEKHDFATRLRFRFGEEKREIDVLATRGEIIIAAECKKWRGRSFSPSRLRQVAKVHEEKCGKLASLFGRNVVPVVVTLLDSGILKEGGVFFVPLFKLNSFLLEIDRFIR